ncbi:MAG: DUF5682 family protein [Bacteroidota bacterium]
MTGGLHIFGIRHHGPGSARRLQAALTELGPDIILLEGPPDANSLLPLIKDEGMEPPVALLVYEPKAMESAAFFPFAHFSPEWQAMQYAVKHDIPFEFIDLPPLNFWKDEDQQDSPGPNPLALIARASGYEDGEAWWEDVIENRHGETDAFTALNELMALVRNKAEAQTPLDKRTARREAYMRQAIHTARQAGFPKVAVVCGAFHAPALESPYNQKADKALLKGMKKVKSACAWIPWTYERLSLQSGYGAGITSPRWYESLYQYAAGDRIGPWMGEVARLLRKEGLEAAPAQVIDGVRLTETLTALRGRSRPGLQELMDAAETVFAGGKRGPVDLIAQKLIIGQRIGRIPPNAPTLPIQADFERRCKKLRLKTEAGQKNVILDLREASQLAKSQFLHQLYILEIGWATLAEDTRKLGTFKETWSLDWQPECAFQVIEAGQWGQKIEAAATSLLKTKTRQARQLPALSQILRDSFLADLPELIAPVAKKLRIQIARDSDGAHLMDAFPDLVQILRYGDVRGTDAEDVQAVLVALWPRLLIHLGAACRHLDQEPAEERHASIMAVHTAVRLLADSEIKRPAPDMLLNWLGELAKLSRDEAVHPLISGTAARIRFDLDHGDWTEIEQLLTLALSQGSTPGQAAQWLHGFLAGSGLLVIHTPGLFELLDNWLQGLPDPHFTEILPLLRRSFSQFSQRERQEIGRLARGGKVEVSQSPHQENLYDADRATIVKPVLDFLLGETEE